MICQPCFVFSEVVVSDHTFSQDFPVYNPPSIDDEKLRREFGDAKGGNRGIRVRGVKIRGVKVRGVKVRGVKVRGVKVRGSSIDATEIDTLADQILEDFGLYESVEEIDDSEFMPIPRRISPLAPEKIGFTTKEQPTLFWYMSDAWQGKMVVKINIYSQKKPFFVTEIDGPGAEGIYKVDLSNHDVELEENVDYEWLIAIIIDSNEPSADIYTTAMIRYVKPDDTLLHV